MLQKTFVGRPGLTSTDTRTRSTFSVCHNSWNTRGRVFRENITMLTKIFNELFECVVWLQKSHYCEEMPPQQTNDVAHYTDL